MTVGITSNDRRLENPPVRRELRVDFPDTLVNDDVEEILTVLDRELKKHGASLDTVGHITLAYPHKHPEIFPMYWDPAKLPAHGLASLLQTRAPRVQWILANGICETIRLDRSENQTSVHALMSHQLYEVHKPSQKLSLPFLDPDNKGNEFFMVVDCDLEQGTTLANFISYLEHNGGKVLAASTKYIGMPLVQKEFNLRPVKTSLSEKFSDDARNTKCLPVLAWSFSESAKKHGRDWSPEECLEMFEQRLKAHGNSLFSMTNNECLRLMNTVRNAYYIDESFPNILEITDRIPATVPKQATTLKP